MPRTATGKILHRVLRDRISAPGATRVASSAGMPALPRVRRQHCRLGLDHCFDRSVDHCHGLDFRRRCGQRFGRGRRGHL